MRVCRDCLPYSGLEPLSQEMLESICDLCNKQSLCLFASRRENYAEELHNMLEQGVFDAYKPSEDDINIVRIDDLNAEV